MPRSQPSPSRSTITRLFHLTSLLIVLHQLIGSNLMEGPSRGRPGDWLYGLHEWAGLFGLVLLTLFWLWVLIRRNETSVGAMLPWFASARRAALVSDVRLHLAALRDRRWPRSTTDALASSTHGLGLVTALIMAATGAATLIGSGGTAMHDLALSIHQVFANLMWAYVVGHATAAALHRIAGDDSLVRMFSLRPQKLGSQKLDSQKLDRSAEEPHS